MAWSCQLWPCLFSQAPSSLCSDHNGSLTVSGTWWAWSCLRLLDLAVPFAWNALSPKMHRLTILCSTITLSEMPSLTILFKLYPLVSLTSLSYFTFYNSYSNLTHTICLPICFCHLRYNVNFMRKGLCLFGPTRDFPGDSVVRNPPANAGDVGLIPRLGRSAGEGNGNPLHYSCLWNPMDKGAWMAILHGVAKQSKYI